MKRGFDLAQLPTTVNNPPSNAHYFLDVCFNRLICTTQKFNEKILCGNLTTIIDKDNNWIIINYLG